MKQIKISNKTAEQVKAIKPEGTWEDRINVLLEYFNRGNSQENNRGLIGSFNPIIPISKDSIGGTIGGIRREEVEADCHLTQESYEIIWKELKPRIVNLFNLMIEEAKRN